MSFGNVITQPCINDTPPPDTRCDDPAFALANPTICPQAATLSVRPEVLLSCVLGSTQLTAVYISNGVEEDVTDDCIWESDNIAIATVGASTGNVTGLSDGSTTITATYQGLSATSEVVVLVDDCCDDINVGMMVVIDKTKSMSQSFGGGYTSKLAFAKAAAKQFISEVNYTKDKVGLISFTDESYTVHSALSSDIVAVEALVNNVIQTQQLTTFYDALSAAIDELDDASIDRKVILLISDGVDMDTSYADAENPLALISDFKAAGGIVICLGTRAHGAGYSLLNSFATGGFFVNGYGSVSAISLSYLSGLKGYICAGNCVPTGDSFDYQGEANFAEFTNWDVIDGHVDLLGPGYIDLIPGTSATNDLYVDLAGSRDEYCGTMLSKDGYAVSAGDTVRVSLSLAGNQRVNASPNTAQVKVFYRNEDEIAAPTMAASAVVTPDGAGLTQDEAYVYAYSYVNANGESELSPTTAVTVSHEDAIVTLTLTIDVPALPTMVYIYRTSGAVPTSRYYKIGEVAVSGGATETFDDTYRLADVLAELANTTSGVIDAGVMPPTQNTTATPISLISQSITIDAFDAGWTNYSFSATAPSSGDVWVSVSQITSPSGYDSVGLLLGEVRLENVTTGVELLTDNFDAENLTYIEPACGDSVIPILTGWNYTYTADQPEVDDPLPITLIGDLGIDYISTPPASLPAVTQWYDAAGQVDCYAAYYVSYVTAEGETAVSPGDPAGGDAGVYNYFHLQYSNANLISWDGSGLDVRITSVRIWRSITTIDWSMGIPTDAESEMRLLAEVPVGDGYYVDKLSCADWAAQYAGNSQGAPTENTTESFSFTATTPIYTYSSVTTGTGCYGTGCLDDPMDAQLPDPNPGQVPDIESGYTPPQVYKATKDATVTCPDGSVNLSDTPLDWTWVSSTQGPPKRNVIQLDDGAAIVRHICWPTGYLGATFDDLVLEGSNDGATWTELFSVAQMSASSGLLPIYLPDNNTAYEYYRLSVSASYPVVTGASFNLFHPDGVFGVAVQSITASASAESEYSQQQADQLATAAAIAYATAQLNCANVYTATVPHTEKCDAGTYGVDSVGAVPASSLISQQDAINLSTEWSEAAAIAGLDCEGSNNESVITIPTTGSSTPYGSVKFVSGETGTITNVLLHLYDLKHSYPDDLHIVLMSPIGTAVCVMRNCGGGTAISTGIDIDFTDGGSDGAAPDMAALTDGSEYAPTQNGVQVALPGPAPQPDPNYGTAMSDFTGEDPNGSWSLWVYDDSTGDGGTIGGWDIEFTLV